MKRQAEISASVAGLRDYGLVARCKRRRHDARYVPGTGIIFAWQKRRAQRMVAHALLLA